MHVILQAKNIIKSVNKYSLESNIKPIHYLTPPLRQKIGKSKGGGLVIHFENFPKKVPKNRRLRRTFKSKQTQVIVMKGVQVHQKNFICTNKKPFVL